MKPEIVLSTKVWRSGSAWVAQMIAKAIAEEGVKIAFVAPLARPEERDPVHENLLRVRTPRERVGSGSKAHRVLASFKRMASGTWHLMRLRGAARTFIFSIPEPLALTLPVFALLRLSGAQVIFIVHDARPHAWSLPQHFRGLERQAHRLSYLLASHLVVLTDAAGKALVSEFSISQDRITVIPHGPFQLGRTSPIPGHGELLVFGSLRRNKSILEVIEGVTAARRSGIPVKLILAGEPLKQEPGYWQECLEAIRIDPDGFDLRPGFVPDERLPDLIAEADAFVLAYQDFNSQSGVGVLASLAGRPVIGSRSGGLGELFDRGMAGEVVAEPVSSESVRDAIARFFAKPAEEWQHRANVSVDAVGEALRWDKIARQYIELARSK